MSTSWRRWVAIAVLGTVSLAVVACGRGSETREITVVVEEDGRAGFRPVTSFVQKGDRVRLVVFNDTDKVHGFTIQGYAVPPLEVGPDKPNNVPFTASKAGTYEIRCQLHPEHHRAILVVE